MNTADVSSKWVSLSSNEQKILYDFFEGPRKMVPFDVLILRQRFASLKTYLANLILVDKLEKGVLAALFLINVLVLLALILYYTCSGQTEGSEQTPPCTCTIDAPIDSGIGKKMKSRHKAKDNTYVRYTNVPSSAKR